MRLRLDHVDYGFSVLRLDASREWLATWVCWDCGAAAGGSTLGTHRTEESAKVEALRSLRAHHERRHAPTEAMVESH